MVKEMDDFEVLVILNESETAILGTILVPKGTELGCDEDSLEGKVVRFRPTFCTDAEAVKRVLGWHRLR